MTCWDDTGESSLLRVFFFVLGSSLILGSSEHIDTILWDLQGKVREVIRDTDGRGYSGRYCTSHSDGCCTTPVGLVSAIPVPIYSGYQFWMGFLEHGEYFGLAAENDEVVGSLIDSLEMRDGLMSRLLSWCTKDHGSSVSGPHRIGMNAKFCSNH